MDNNETIDVLYTISIVVLVLIVCGIFYYLFGPTQNKNQKFEIKYINRVNNFKEKIKVLEGQKENNTQENNTQEIINKKRELFELYYRGVPDTYDLNGKLIHGVEPNAFKAIDYLLIVIKSPHSTEKDVLNLAKIYHYGMHMFDRNLDKAEEIYNSLKNSRNVETMEIVKEALSDIQKIRVYSWLNLPLEPVIPVTPVVPEIPENPEIQQRRVIQPVINQPINNLPNYPRRQQLEDKSDQKGYNDPQNTHNSQVLGTVKHSLHKLKNNIFIAKNPSDVIFEINSFIHTLPDSDKKNDALKSLLIIENGREKITGLDMTEMDALTLVWNRLNDSSKFTKETTENLKETLFDELSSMQEFGTTICLTGRFTRIIDTLNGVDDEIAIKPTYIINEEMLTKSAHIRKELINELPESDRISIENGTSPMQVEFDTKLRNIILTKLKEDYVDTKILTETKFNTQVNSWINEI